jgi:Putative peptidoglycan binding domain
MRIDEEIAVRGLIVCLGMVFLALAVMLLGSVATLQLQPADGDQHHDRPGSYQTSDVVFAGRDQPTKEPPSVEPAHTALSVHSPNPTANIVRTIEPTKDAVPPSKDITQIQSRLIELGYLGGSADGVWGSKSRAALRAFKSAHGLQPDEHWDDTVGKRLFSKSAVRPLLPIAKAQ